MEILKKLYTEKFGCPPDEISPITGSGSARQYFRLSGPVSVVGVIGKEIAENEAFIYLDRKFRDDGLPVPSVIAVSDDLKAYLQEDLGALSLFDALAEARKTGSYSESDVALLKKTIRGLSAIQYVGGKGLDYNVCFPVDRFDRRSIMWDLNYFKYCMGRVAGVEIDEPCLENEFERLADMLLASPAQTFMYRDFQSRNVMIRNGEPFFIDFQGGRKGPAEYDVASFLWQARAAYPEPIRELLIEEYIEEARKYAAVDPTKFAERLRLFVFFRMLQVLGAYGLRGLVEQKAHFLESIPGALGNIRSIAANRSLADFPEILRIVNRLSDKFTVAMQNSSHLCVTVESFSYKLGLPHDLSGHGGGFIFDCRAIHNPGRYDEYKALTGRDSEVADFLEKNSDVSSFLSHCYALVDASVEVYLRRGFTHLSVGFGCTGGQHRSVYCAESMARHLHEKFGVEIILRHRSRNIVEHFKQVDNKND